ncbi:methyltransferase domain-containing protein [Candidatus Saccharibacteria bacterium]|nr:MAG: methyltransferase domain-containing protein [Candidatus Saccharibacteria bacterium]
MSVKTKLGYPVKLLKHIYQLPHMAKRTEDAQTAMGNRIDELERLSREANERIVSILNTISVLPNLDSRILGLQHRLDVEKHLTKSRAPETIESVNNTVSDNHEFDYFYKLFEDKFRGSEEDIKERISEHLPLFLSLSPITKKLPIIDIGCGRGELLSLLKDNKLKAVGVDMNASMVQRAKKLGYDAVENDALSFLLEQKSSSLAAITGFHIVEHIPFEALLKIFEQCYRTVSPQGFVLFETPNPQAVTVGANTFYLDPSHQKPIPPQLLAFMLESVGFKPEIVPLHRVRPEVNHQDKIIAEMYETLYGHGDYAVIARKVI